MRGALGASRLRVVQQLLAEGLRARHRRRRWPGSAAAYYGVDVLKAAFGDGAAARRRGRRRRRACWRSRAIVAVATGLLAAFVPAWQLTGRDANDALKTGPGRGNSSAGDGRVRNLLVVSEVALALMLLIGAGLLMRSLSGLRAVDPGFDASNVLTGTDRHSRSEVRRRPEQRNQFFDRALQNVRALPGVESAAWIDIAAAAGRLDAVRRRRKGSRR